MIDTASDIERPIAVEERFAVVTKDDVGSAASSDDIVTDTTDNGIDAAGQFDDVIATVRIAGVAANADQCAIAGEGHRTVIAQHDADVVGRTAGSLLHTNRIGATAADDDVESFADNDLIVATDFVGDRFHRRCAVLVDPDSARVADHKIGAWSELDPLITGPGDDSINTAPEVEQVCAADTRIGAFGQDQFSRCIEDNTPLVAENCIRAVTGGDAVHTDAADHDVVAITHIDRVVATDS